MFLRIFIFLIISYTYFAQGVSENLIYVTTKGNDKIYVNSSGLEKFKNDDIFAWVVTDHLAPITIESVEEKISKTKTYYLFNKRLNKYSILFLVYYDDVGNVLASFDYSRNTNVEVYQYNYPIWENTAEYSILKKCIEIIETTREEK